MVLCGIQCVDLVLDTFKILGTHFSCNEKLKDERSFCFIVANIQRVLKLRKLQNLTLEIKIIIFKNYFSSVCYTNTNLRSYWTRKNTKKILSENLTSKPKRNTICNDYKNGGLKNVDIRKNFIILQCSWIKGLHDELFHEWKIIPLHLISRRLGKSFIFHSNLSFKKKLITSFPSFYNEILPNWKLFFQRHQKHLPVFFLRFHSLIWMNKCDLLQLSFIRKPYNNIVFRI